MAKKQPRPRGEKEVDVGGGERERRKSQEAHYPRKYGRLSSSELARERRSDDAIRGLYHSFPSWRLLRGETASPFRDFMTNLFDDRGTIYGRAVAPVNSSLKFTYQLSRVITTRLQVSSYVPDNPRRQSVDFVIKRISE